MEALGKDGQYELQDKIGEGPRGAVHRATDRRRGAAVIVKRLDPAKVSTAAISRLAAAVAAARKADTAGLVLPLEVVAQEPAPFVVMPALEGETLEALLRRDGALQWASAVEIVEALATTLAAVAAGGGGAHRALKPTNVWLARDGAVQLLDFGVAALEQAGPLLRDKLWVEYRAPEQLEGSPGDGRSDVFSLAVLLFELTTGEHPFAGATAYQAAQKLSQTPPALTELTRGMSLAGVREATRLMQEAFAEEPEDRPADVAAFARLLARARPIVGAPAPTRLTRSESDVPAPPPDPSTLQSLPHLRELLGLRTNPAATPPAPAPPATSPPVSSPPPASIVSTPATTGLEPLPPTEILIREEVPRDIPRPSTRPPSVASPPRRSGPTSSAPARAAPPSPALDRLAPEPEDFPTEAGVFQRPASPADALAPEPEDFPTEAGIFQRPETSRPLAAARPAPAPTPAARAEHTVIDRSRSASGTVQSDRTVVDFAAPIAAPRPAPTPGVERTEILKQSDIDEDDENRPTRAMIREPRGKDRGEGTLMLPDLPIADEPEVAAASGKPAVRGAPSAKVQWTLVAVNAITVLLVLAALAYSFLL